MPDQFMHGIEIVEIDDGIRPIQTVRSSIIGLVGTAPSSPAALAASLAIGAGNGGLVFTAKTAGAVSNQISIALTLPAQNNAVLAVTVSGSAITASLATNASGVATSTAAQIKAAIEAFAAADALLAVTYPIGGNGSGVVAASQAARLTGGADEPFPLNVPVLIAGPRMASLLGDLGTLRAAYYAAYAQGVGTMIVVRVAAGLTPAATIANVAGSPSAQSGAYALLTSETITGQVPRILAAPGFTSNAAPAQAQPATLALIAVAQRLRAVVVADGPNTTEADALTERANYGTDRLYIVDPAVRVQDSVSDDIITRSASGYVAGLISATDATKGFWWSPSNRIVNGIVGTARPIDFGISDPETQANRLNERAVATIVRKEGFRLWGNRTTATDPLWSFLPVRRTADMVYESIEAALLWAMDRPFSEQLLRDIQGSVQEYINSLKARGAILGGRVWVDPELNSAADLSAGKLTIDFDIEPPAPLEHLTFRAQRNGSYYNELVTAVAANT